MKSECKCDGRAYSVGEFARKVDEACAALAMPPRNSARRPIVGPRTPADYEAAERSIEFARREHARKRKAPPAAEPMTAPTPTPAEPKFHIVGGNVVPIESTAMTMTAPVIVADPAADLAAARDRDRTALNELNASMLADHRARL